LHRWVAISRKRPVMAQPVGVGRWWNVTKLPTGWVELKLDPRKIGTPLGWDVGFTAAGIGFSAWALRSFSPALALASTVGSVVMAGRRFLHRMPTRWLLKPGWATLEDRCGEEHRYVPARVVLMRKRHPDWSEDRPMSRTSHVSFALFLETAGGKQIAIHRGIPGGDRMELARAVAEALRVELVEREWVGIHVGPVMVRKW
jgi:hypothetical protein